MPFDSSRAALTLTATDIFGSKLSFQECIVALEQINLRAAIGYCCLLKNMNERVFWNLNDLEKNEIRGRLISLFNFIFSDDVATLAIDQYLNYPGPYRPLSDQSLVALVVMVARYCSDSSDNVLESIYDRQLLTKVLLSLQDSTMSDDYQNRIDLIQSIDDINEEDFGVFYRNIALHQSRQDFIRSIARLYIFTKLIDDPLVDKCTQRLISKWFEDYFQMSPYDYLCCSFLICSLGQKLDPENPDVRSLIYDPHGWFKSVQCRFRKIHDILNLCISSVEKYAEDCPDNETLHEILYGISRPIVRPIIADSDNIFVFSQNLLMRKLIFGLPYLAQETYRENIGRELSDNEVKKVRSGFGQIFEEYVRWIIRKWFSGVEDIQIFYNYRVGDNNAERDILIILGRVAYTIEVSTVMQTLSARLTGNVAKIKRLLKRITAQTYSAAKSVLTGDTSISLPSINKVVRVVPVALIYDSFAILSPFSQIFEKAISKETNTDYFAEEDDILPVQYLTIDDLENFETYISVNENPKDILHILQKRALDKELRYDFIGACFKYKKDDHKASKGILDRMADESQEVLSDLRSFITNGES